MLLGRLILLYFHQIVHIHHVHRLVQCITMMSLLFIALRSFQNLELIREIFGVFFQEFISGQNVGGATRLHVLQTLDVFLRNLSLITVSGFDPILHDLRTFDINIIRIVLAEFNVTYRSLLIPNLFHFFFILNKPLVLDHFLVYILPLHYI